MSRVGNARHALERLDPLWDELFSAEPARIVPIRCDFIR
jgi:hypothetical protein